MWLSPPAVLEELRMKMERNVQKRNLTRFFCGCSHINGIAPLLTLQVLTVNNYGIRSVRDETCQHSTVIPGNIRLGQQKQTKSRSQPMVLFVPTHYVYKRTEKHDLKYETNIK